MYIPVTILIYHAHSSGRIFTTDRTLLCSDNTEQRHGAEISIQNAEITNKFSEINEQIPFKLKIK